MCARAGHRYQRANKEQQCYKWFHYIAFLNTADDGKNVAVAKRIVRAAGKDNGEQSPYPPQHGINEEGSGETSQKTRCRLIQGCFCRATQNVRLMFLGFSAARQPREGPKAKKGFGAAAVIIPGYVHNMLYRSAPTTRQQVPHAKKNRCVHLKDGAAGAPEYREQPHMKIRKAK